MESWRSGSIIGVGHQNYEAQTGNWDIDAWRQSFPAVYILERRSAMLLTYETDEDYNIVQLS